MYHGKIKLKLKMITHLNSSATGRHKRFHSGRKVTTGKLLLLSFSALDNRNGHQSLVDLCVQFQDVVHLLDSFLLISVGSVTLLPQELSGAEERLRMLKLPPLQVTLRTEIQINSKQLTTTLFHWLSLRGKSL
jgi:hypothetical protein